MQNNEQTINALNDLVRINHDRVRGWELAIKDSEGVDVDIKTMSHEKISESKRYLQVLEGWVRQMGGTPATDSTVSGKLFRVWMDFKATVTGKDKEAILNSCAYGEKAAVEAYEEALATDAHLSDNFRQTIAEQKSSIQKSQRNVESQAKMLEQAA